MGQTIMSHLRRKYIHFIGIFKLNKANEKEITKTHTNKDTMNIVDKLYSLSRNLSEKMKTKISSINSIVQH